MTSNQIELAVVKWPLGLKRIEDLPWPIRLVSRKELAEQYPYAVGHPDAKTMNGAKDTLAKIDAALSRAQERGL